VTTDRRKPVARYVRFADEATQAHFVEAADDAYQALAKADRWTASARFPMPSGETVTKRRGLLRRAVEVPVAPVSVLVTPALAAACGAALDAPSRFAAIGGCDAGRRLAAVIAEVIVDLVRDLAALDIDEQRPHPAYTQTVRLASELDGLRRTTVELGCQDPAGCVALRPPEQWGRRIEDVEITEVRSVLLELAARAKRH
jgi:hypothetical protein